MDAVVLERKKRKEDKLKQKELKARNAALKATDVAKKAGRDKRKDDENQEAVDPTPSGEKKRQSATMATTYNPRPVETSWYSWWEESGFFKADPSSDKPKFSMVMPPPNVTGKLHIGHALMCAIQDLVARHRRMHGFETLWLPGVDHAGIATQVVVERSIAQDGLSRHELGRDAFLHKVHEWKDTHQAAICNQFREMGVSVDWSREYFTMDKKRSEAVIEAFVRFYEDGLITRSDRLVNWDCSLKTAVSVSEVNPVEVSAEATLSVPGYDKPIPFGTLHLLAYPVEDGGEIVVATTRPETIFGDTAVAVHPTDERYMGYHNKFVVHPFNGNKLPVICDGKLVNKDAGTGAVKITPAHDHKDFLCGKRHHLPMINVMTDDGKINSHGGEEFLGLKRYDARFAVIEALKKKGLYRGSKGQKLEVGVCSRSGDVLEPLMKPQWYVDCWALHQKALEATRDSTLTILPPQFLDTWNRILESNIDWCVSRQLWWGHRIPAWYATLESDDKTTLGAYNDHWAVARTENNARAIVEQRFPGVGFTLEQDADVLDTWFSSALLPFSALGWPNETQDLKAFYPTTLLETGHDILFVWVARMVMLGFQLTGEAPFNTVSLHAMIRDAYGRKMSKSLGNTIDPLDVIRGATLDELTSKLKNLVDQIEKDRAYKYLEQEYPTGIPECGADALRFGLIAYTGQSENILLDVKRIVGYRHWCNKIWNAVRFALLKLEADFQPSSDDQLDAAKLPWCCQWILSTLNTAIKETDTCLTNYDFCGASSVVYAWWQYQLCDVFIELTKPLLGEQQDTTPVKNTLWLCLETGLRLLHPFMPFVTEELWQRINRSECPSIMLAPYPIGSKAWHNPKVEEEMREINTVVGGIRSFLASKPVQKGRRSCFLASTDAAATELLSNRLQEISTLAKVTATKIVDNQASDEQPGYEAVPINRSVTVYVRLNEGATNA